MNDKTKTQTAEISCPRCDGLGRRNEWNPDAGICYRCKGRTTVSINVPRHAAALRHLRARFVSLRAEVQAASDDNRREAAANILAKVTNDGIRLRAELDTARAAL